MIEKIISAALVRVIIIIIMPFTGYELAAEDLENQEFVHVCCVI